MSDYLKDACLRHVQWILVIATLTVEVRGDGSIWGITVEQLPKSMKQGFRTGVPNDQQDTCGNRTI
jgi:hypothetical protein